MPILKYVNSVGETIEFTKPTYYIDFYDLRNFAWNYDSEYEKITSFNHDGVATKTLSLYILGQNKVEAYLLRDILFMTFERDVLNKNPGGNPMKSGLR